METWSAPQWSDAICTFMLQLSLSEVCAMHLPFPSEVSLKIPKVSVSLEGEIKVVYMLVWRKSQKIFSKLIKWHQTWFLFLVKVFSS